MDTLRRLRRSVNDLQLSSKFKKLSCARSTSHELDDEDDKKLLMPRVRNTPIPVSAYSLECTALCRLFNEHMHMTDHEVDELRTPILSQTRFGGSDDGSTMRADDQSDASSMLTAYAPSYQPPRRCVFHNQEALALLEGRAESGVQRAPSLLSVSSQSLAWAEQNADIVRSMIIEKGLAVTVRSSSMQFADIEWSEDELECFRLYVMAAERDCWMD